MTADRADAGGERGASESFDLESDDFDEIVAVMTAVFGTVQTRRDQYRAPSLRIRSRQGLGLRVMRWSLAGECAGALDRRGTSDNEVLAGYRFAGDVDLLTAGKVIDTSRPYLCPEQIDSHVSSSDVLNLVVDRALIDRQAAALIGVDQFDARFTDQVPIDPPRAEVWRDTLAYTSRAISSLEQHPQFPLYETAVQQLVASVLLQSFPNTALDAADRGSAMTGAAVRRALRFIDDNLDRPIGAADIAAASRMSLRGLHAAFRRELNETPIAHVKRARLAAIREELANRDPETVDVVEMAMRWGFRSAQQLIRLHLQVYGEPFPAGRRAGGPTPTSGAGLRS